MPTGERTDPFRSFNFKVQFDGLSAVAFRECSGLTADGDPVEYREGTDKPLTVRKLIGLRKYTNVVLKRGYTSDNSLWTWYRDIVNGKTTRRNGTITLIDEEGNEVMRWEVENAWPNKIEGPTFNATGNEVAMETLELCHEGIMLEM
jgi:phage tail-like protein